MPLESPPHHMMMSSDRREEIVADLLHWPCAGILPDAAVDALSVWWLKKLGVLQAEGVKRGGNPDLAMRASAL